MTPEVEKDGCDVCYYSIEERPDDYKKDSTFGYPLPDSLTEPKYKFGRDSAGNPFYIYITF